METNEYQQILKLLAKAKQQNMSKEIIERLEWLLYYAQYHSVSKTCRVFNISRSTFYRWYNRFDPADLESITDKPCIGPGVLLREYNTGSETKVENMLQNAIIGGIVFAMIMLMVMGILVLRPHNGNAQHHAALRHDNSTYDIYTGPGLRLTSCTEPRDTYITCDFKIIQ